MSILSVIGVVLFALVACAFCYIVGKRVWAEQSAQKSNPLNFDKKVTPASVTGCSEVHLDLPSGRKAIIYSGVAAHARKATEMTGGDTGLYLHALISQLVSIDGKFMILEEVDRMPLQDYFMIKVNFQSQNF